MTAVTGIYITIFSGILLILKAIRTDDRDLKTLFHILGWATTIIGIFLGIVAPVRDVSETQIPLYTQQLGKYKVQVVELPEGIELSNPIVKVNEFSKTAWLVKRKSLFGLDSLEEIRYK